MKFSLIPAPVFLAMAAGVLLIETGAFATVLPQTRCAPQVIASPMVAGLINGFSSMWLMYLLMAFAHCEPWVRLIRERWSNRFLSADEPRGAVRPVR